MIAVIAVILILFGLSSPSAAGLPTDDEVRGIMKLCGGGAMQSVEGDIEASIKAWRRGIGASGKASYSDLSAILMAMQSNGKLDKDLYIAYTACITEHVKIFIEREKNQEQTNERRRKEIESARQTEKERQEAEVRQKEAQRKAKEVINQDEQLVNVLSRYCLIRTITYHRDGTMSESVREVARAMHPLCPRIEYRGGTVGGGISVQTR